MGRSVRIQASTRAVEAACPAPQPPKVRKVTGWIMSHPENGIWESG